MFHVRNDSHQDPAANSQHDQPDQRTARQPISELHRLPPRLSCITTSLRPPRFGVSVAVNRHTTISHLRNPYDARHYHISQDPPTRLARPAYIGDRTWLHGNVRFLWTEQRPTVDC